MRDEANPLLQAIASMRVELDRRIDAEIQRWALEEARSVSLRREPPASWAPETATTASPAATSAADDAFARLDVLARHLDGRRRQGAAAPAD